MRRCSGSSPRARTAPPRSSARSTRISMLDLHRIEVLGDETAIGIAVQPFTDQLRSRGERQVDRLAPERRQGLVLLRGDVTTGPIEQVLLLLPGTLEQRGTLLFRSLTRVGEELLRRGARLCRETFAFLQRGVRVGLGLLGCRELGLDLLLPLLRRLHDRRPGELAEDPEQREED